MQQIYNMVSLVIILILAFGMYFKNLAARAYDGSIQSFMDGIASFTTHALDTSKLSTDAHVEREYITAGRGVLLRVMEKESLIVSINIWWFSPGRNYDRQIEWTRHKTNNFPALRTVIPLCDLGRAISITNEYISAIQQAK